MTSYQKLKDKETVLRNLLDNLYADIKSLKEMNTIEGLMKNYNGEMPDKLEIIEDTVHMLEMSYNLARDDLWAIERRK